MKLNLAYNLEEIPNYTIEFKRPHMESVKIEIQK
jgi:hypothetical protein